MALSGGIIAAIVISIIVVLVIVITVPLVLKKHPTPTPPAQQCSATQPCTDPTQECVNGQCVPIPVIPCQNGNCNPPLICNASTNTCQSPGPSQQCSNNNQCPAGYSCDLVSGTCQPIVPGTCSTNNDCKDPNNPKCCLRGSTQLCSQCCNTTDCDLNKGEICVNGQCVVPPPPTTCSSNANCTNAAAPNCCNGTCQQCCTNANCGVAQLCQNGTCVTPATGAGLVLPWMSVGGWYFVPSQEFGGSLIIYGLGTSADRISFTLQGDGNLATRCAGPCNTPGCTGPVDPTNLNNVIGAFSFGGSYGQNSDGSSRTSIQTCPGMSLPVQCNPACSNSQTCVIGVCENLPAGGANFDYLVIGGVWLIVPIFNDLYFVNVNQQSPQNGSYIKLQGDGNIISICANGGPVATLIAGPPFSSCTDQSVSSCPAGCGFDETTQSISQFCLVNQGTNSATCQPLTGSGVILSWLQLSTWTIYATPQGSNLSANDIKTQSAQAARLKAKQKTLKNLKNAKQLKNSKNSKQLINSVGSTTGRTQLWFENSGQQRISYTFEGAGNIISYCRGTDGVTKQVSGSLGSGTNGAPGIVAFCANNPIVPVSNSCVSNSDCTSPGEICIGRTCQTAPTIL